jgi:hypothetical protein
VQHGSIEKSTRRDRLDTAVGHRSSSPIAGSFLSCAWLHVSVQCLELLSKEKLMGNVFYIIGVIVVVLVVLSYLGLR